MGTETKEEADAKGFKIQVQTKGQRGLQLCEVQQKSLAYCGTLTFVKG